MTLLVIRVRANQGVNHSIRETMDYLNLTRVNHAVLIPETETYAGMLKKSKDYVTWGEISADTVAELISERGRLIGDKPVTDADVKAETEYKTIAAFAAAIAAGDASVKDMPSLKRVFRMHPPRGAQGWGGIKRAFTIGGALGNRGSAITELAQRML